MRNKIVSFLLAVSLFTPSIYATSLSITISLKEIKLMGKLKPSPVQTSNPKVYLEDELITVSFTEAVGAVTIQVKSQDEKIYEQEVEINNSTNIPINIGNVNEGECTLEITSDNGYVYGQF